MASGDLKGFIEREQELSKERLRNWCVWKVLLPLVMLVLLYPLYRFVLELEHPFARAFAHGDLILFSILVLLEASVEGEHLKSHGWIFHIGLSVAKVLAIVLMFAYGAIKADVVRKEHEMSEVSSAAALVLEKMAHYSLFSWVVAAFAVIYSFAAFWAVVARERQERFSVLAGDP